MSLHSNFPNYYELLNIPITASPSEIRAGHVHAVARTSTLQHRKICDAALAVLQNTKLRDEYDEELRNWNLEQLENGTNKTKIAVRTIQDADEEIASANKSLEAANEIIFDYKYTDQKRLMIARRDVHRLCRDAAGSAGRIQKWSKEVLYFCEEADNYVTEIRYLMETKAKALNQQIRNAERDARDFEKQAKVIVEKARDLEADVEAIMTTAPKRVNPIVSGVSSAAETTTNVLTFTNNALQLTLRIIGYSILLIIILVVIGIVLLAVLAALMR